MDVGKVASLYILGSEEAVAGNEMYLTATLRRPYSAQVLVRAYHRFVLENPLVASKLVEVAGGWEWRPFSPDELRARLGGEEEALRRIQDPALVYSEYFPTNTRLPFRIAPTGPKTLVFCGNHAFMNGRAGIAWISRFFETYAREVGSALDLPRQSSPPAPPALQRWLAAAVGVFWTLCYVFSFLRRAGGKRAAADTVDLAVAGASPVCRSGFAVRTFHFTRQETAALLARCKRLGLTPIQHVGAVMAEAALAEQPGRSRVLCSMPVDLRGELPHLGPFAVGNYTGSLVVQLFRGGDLGAQLRSASRWLRRRVPYWLARLVGLGAEAKVLARFRTQATRPNAARAPFENFTFALSNLGRIASPLLNHFVERMSGHTRTQTIFVATLTHDDMLAIEVSFPRGLFAPETVDPVLDRLDATLRDEVPYALPVPIPSGRPDLAPVPGT